jgi:hypothetical protein
MNEAIYGDDLDTEIIEVGDGSLEISISAGQPGSAGEVSIRLGHGLTLSVDFAEPQQLVGIHIDPLPEGLGRGLYIAQMFEILQTLIGPECAVEIENLLASRQEGTAVVRGEGGVVRSEDPYLRKNLAALQLGLAIHLVEIANDRGELLGVRLLAAFESLRQIERIGNRIMAEIFEQIFVESVESIRFANETDTWGFDDLDADMGELVSIDQKIAMLSEDLITFRDIKLPAQLVELRERVLGILRDRRNVIQGETAHDVESAILSDEESVENPPSLVETSPGRLELTWTRRPKGSSLRVLDRNDQVVLAVAPIRQSDSKWIAEAVYPMDLTVSGIFVGATDQPFPMAEGRVLDRVLAAIRLGQEATARSIHRRSSRDEIKSAWTACGRAWKELGDSQRAQQAFRYAEGQRHNRERFFVDDVRDALEGTAKSDYR